MNKNPYRNSDAYKAKRNAYVRAYYKEKYAKKQIASNRRYRTKNKLWLDDLKATLKCNRCPENATACLDFHHVEPSKKEYNLFQMVNHGCSKKTILAEIKKCEVLCANCHRKHHASVK